MFNSFPKRGRQKKKKIMKKSSNEIFMLQYRIKRYQEWATELCAKH